MSVDGSYLDTTFIEYGITKGTSCVPDISVHLEKTLTDGEAKKPLSDESYGKFRRALGKLLWLAQCRHDIKLYLSLIGSHQAAPMQGTENALRALLRFMKADKEVALCFPSPSYADLSSKESVNCFLHGFADASFAPYRFNSKRNNRRSSVLRGLPRQDGSSSTTICKS